MFHEFKTAAQEQTNYTVPGHRFFKSEQTVRRRKRRTTQEEDKHRRSVQMEEDKHWRRVNGGGYFRRRTNTGGVQRRRIQEEDATGGKVQEECRGTLRDPRCLGPTLKHACRICYFLADRTTTVLCGRPGPLGHFSKCTAALCMYAWRSRLLAAGCPHTVRRCVFPAPPLRGRATRGPLPWVVRSALPLLSKADLHARERD